MSVKHCTRENNTITFLYNKTKVNKIIMYNHNVHNLKSSEKYTRTQKDIKSLDVCGSYLTFNRYTHTHVHTYLKHEQLF